MMRIIDFVKRNIVLTIAWVLAIVSMLFVVPSREYLGYIDFKTLLILWSLMVITHGLMEQGVFRILAHKLVSITSNERQLGLALIVTTFVLSMVITNDVALITFVPFTIYIFYEREEKSNLILILVLETVGANLGSMVTPIGNPQNLYLFNLSGLEAGEFVGLMMPMYLLSFGLLIAASFFIKKGNSKDEGITLSAKSSKRVSSIPLTILYLLLMALAISVVLGITSVYIMAGVTLVTFAIFNRRSLVKVDYSLIFTFVGFFIFVGNMGRIHLIENVMSTVVSGNEMVVGILASQVISNVPAALLLSNFTDNIELLIKAVNIGGLGTLIASMASLITFKLYSRERFADNKSFIMVFTLVNVVGLMVLVLFEYLI